MYVLHVNARTHACMQVIVIPVTHSDLQLVLAICIGIIFAMCTFLLLSYIRKHPDKAKKIFFSFMSACSGFQGWTALVLPC